MPDFKALNLDSRLISNTSLMNQADRITSSVDFDITTDRNIIGNTKLKNFSFNAGTGGTIVLGGANNGNGLLKVRSAAGGTAAILDNTGLTIFGGNITVINSTGGTFLDSSGIVSTVNFPSYYVFSNAPGTTTSTSYVAVSGATLPSFVLTRQSKVLVFVSLFGFNPGWYNNGYSVTVQGTDSINGQVFSVPLTWNITVIDIDFVGQNWFTRETDDKVAIQTIGTFDAGTHSLSLNFKANGGGSAVLDDFAYGYVVLGA
jgi:hypothetical protein